MEQLMDMLFNTIRDAVNLSPGYLLTIDFDDYQIDGSNNTLNSIKVDFADLPKFKYVSLFSASIPKSYYMINSPYNTFLVNASTITITPGNYSQITLRTELLSKIIAAGFADITITYNNTTGKYTFNSALISSFTFEAGSDMGIRMGFSVGVHNFSAGSLTSELQIDLQLCNVLVVQSSLVRSRSQNSINQSILMVIPDTSIISSPVTFINPDPHSSRIQIEKIGTIFDINLFDNNNRPLQIQSASNLVLIFYET